MHIFTAIFKLFSVSKLHIDKLVSDFWSV